MQVKKHSGDLVPFNLNSLIHSLSRSGASSIEVDLVYDKIKPSLYDGISTRELYELAFNKLKELRNTYAARYSLKKALRDLGPEGFYFEKWIARLFQDDGYEAQTGTTLKGHAVSHEIDVIATKDNELLAIECKFRNDIDAKISVTTPMYFRSRLTDISNMPYTLFNKTLEVTQGWLVTNAYLTADSKKFGEYYKLNLLSWDYPADNSIKVRVDNNGEYPITCLTTIDAHDKAQLLKAQFILVKDILRKPTCLTNTVRLAENKIEAVLMEARELVNSPLYEHG